MTREPQGHEYWFTGGILEPELYEVADATVVRLWDTFPVPVQPGDSLRFLRTGAGLQVGAIQPGEEW